MTCWYLSHYMNMRAMFGFPGLWTRPSVHSYYRSLTKDIWLNIKPAIIRSLIIHSTIRAWEAGAGANPSWHGATAGYDISLSQGWHIDTNNYSHSQSQRESSHQFHLPKLSNMWVFGLKSLEGTLQAQREQAKTPYKNCLSWQVLNPLCFSG